MASPPLSPEQFREECERRLIDAFDLMNIAHLRSREGIQGRVRSGALPQPVFKTTRTSLWDRDEVAEHLAQQKGKP